MLEHGITTFNCWLKGRTFDIYILRLTFRFQAYSESSRQSTSQSLEDGLLKGQNSSIEGTGKEIEIQRFN
ncbi:unnamed protein product, partial [Vitis vinifera]